MQFILPDSSRVYLDRFSEVTLSQIADPRTGAQNNILTLEQGRLLIVLALRSGFSSTIKAPDNLRAQVLGSVMGVSYRSGGIAPGGGLPGGGLPGGKRAGMSCNSAAGSIPGRARIRSAGWKKRATNCGWILRGADPAWITPTPLPTATPTSTPTATRKFIPAKTTEAPPPPGEQPSATPEATATVEILPTDPPPDTPIDEPPPPEEPSTG